MNNIKQALESAIEFIESTASFIPVDYDNIGIDAVKQCKAALTELDKCEPVVLERDYNFMRDLAVGCEDAWNKLQEQEPVAWTKQSELDKTTTLTNPIVMWKNKYRSIENNIPLYTSPPQPQTVKDALEKAAAICERDYIRFKQTEEAHYRQSAKPFNPIDFGFNMNDVNRAFHTALEIRALIEKE